MIHPFLALASVSLSAPPQGWPHRHFPAHGLGATWPRSRTGGALHTRMAWRTPNPQDPAMKAPQNAPPEQVDPPFLSSFPPWGTPPPTTATGKKAATALMHLSGDRCPLSSRLVAGQGHPMRNLEPAPSLPSPPRYLLCASPTSPMGLMGVEPTSALQTGGPLPQVCPLGSQ